MNKYIDILNNKHYELRYHPKMSIESRAAQFAPFDALTGYQEELQEMQRETIKRKELAEDEQTLLNRDLQNIKKNRTIQITYFVPDKRKVGGSYQKTEGIIKRIDEVEKILILENKKIIPITQIIEIKEIDNML